MVKWFITLLPSFLNLYSYDLACQTMMLFILIDRALRVVNYGGNGGCDEWAKLLVFYWGCWYNQERETRKHGGMLVTLRKWSFLFYTTLLMGALGAVITGAFIGMESLGGGFGNFGIGIFGRLIMGLMFSIISQMGFFAYLMLNYLALSVLRRKSLWLGVQVLLILFVFVDLVVLRHDLFAKEEPILGYVWLPFSLLVYAVVVAYFKVKATNASAWIPTVFFMFVVTVLEWLPALKENNPKAMIMMIVPLLLCNTWQIMQLHRVLQKNESLAK
ncbi:KinB-signaling pathway activation protein [Aneurinibacillus sp. XH2]|uniref:KinB-signaling pathway activation protein n=1 Tax=Aneurinibacillus sp. XH2 TaxID=1450761 RepID=UPI001F171E04|nr:KinB-signaling pathway activation protein [Aneurinibacillus sp. XH2]